MHALSSIHRIVLYPAAFLPLRSRIYDACIAEVNYFHLRRVVVFGYSVALNVYVAVAGVFVLSDTIFTARVACDVDSL